MSKSFHPPVACGPGLAQHDAARKMASINSTCGKFGLFRLRPLFSGDHQQATDREEDR
tara:strand:- start:501 stop:674 length:174 start_codon:yes stop_codon:yes gene_type:complete